MQICTVITVRKYVIWHDTKQMLYDVNLVISVDQ